MAALGVIITVIGLGGFLLLLTGVIAPVLPYLEKMPGGLLGWLIVGGVGIALTILTRRPGD